MGASCMSTVVRGARNAFRNTIRTGGVTVILALSVGLALVMFLSLKAVNSRIQSVKSSIGNTVTISPAGARGFEGGGEPLTQGQIDSVKSLAHVTKVTSSLDDRLQPTTDTNLASAIDPGTLGNRFRNRGGNFGGQSGQTGQNGNSAPQTFTIPITVNGVGEVTAAAVNASSLKFTSGSAIDATSTANVADIGTGLATKNSLRVGSTFTYGGATVTVSGIFDAGNTFANAGIIMPIAAVQALSGQAGQISMATATVDDISNVSAITTAIKNKLGDTADVVSQQDQATSVIAPLQNIQSLALYSLIGALVAGSVITFLTMLMTVRERRREIGVLKAIGASNIKIVGQFVSESLTLTGMGAVLGVLGGLLLANPILKLLVTNAVTTAGLGGGGAFGGGGRGFARVIGGSIGGGRAALQTLQATIGLDVLLYGLLAAVLIAVLGSAIPSWLIAKVRPAEVMRGE
jgi:putative ABC transport system permease protein